MSDRVISIDLVAQAMRFARPPRDALELLGWLRAYGLDPDHAATLAQAAELSAERLSEEHAALVTRVREMEQALAHYTEATIVTDWGMQELGDIGGPARQALGLPEPDEHTLAARLGLACLCPDCWGAGEDE